MLKTLRQISLFQELTEEQLQCLPQGIDLWLNPGDILFNQGDPPEYFYIVFKGAVQISRQVANQELILATYDTGQFFGEVPLLAGSLHLASGQAVDRSHVYCLKEEDFWHMLTICPSLRKEVLGYMANRMQELQVLSQQREKLISLGTLAAGLAHELNNPASAARRSAGQLRTTLDNLQSLGLMLIEQHLTPVQQERLLELQRKGIEQAATPNHLDPLVQTDREDELTDWLESYGINDSWKLVPTLVGSGLNPERLESIGLPSSANIFNQVLSWLETTLVGANLLNELDQSTIRISELIQAIKDYSFMDQSPLQEVDIHEGLDNTLIILGHKLRTHSISVIREYALDLLCVWAHGSELNQVWTNLIDNAIDALGEGGKIWVRTLSEKVNEKDYVIVEIADNGPGIPPQIQSRIFEPFFTTKQVGAGTGLGLEIAYRIIVSQHHGDIRCFSQPGNTCFQIRLPIASILPKKAILEQVASK